MTVPAKNFDIVIVGAGAAGLSAANALGSSGLSLLVLEARERIGGRMFTERDPVCRVPVELGAEFIHGRPPEILGPLQSNGNKILETEGDSWCNRDGTLSQCDFFSEVDDILQLMDEKAPDESFLSFLDRCCGDPKITAEAKQSALDYVIGFNAANPALVGVHWLVDSIRAEEKIDGNRTFRPQNGYADLINIFQRQLAEQAVVVQTSAVVENFRWTRNHVEITGTKNSGPFVLKARSALITLPLGVLQAPAGGEGAVRFSPALPDRKIEALGKLGMGKIIRITLRFRRRFWERISAGSSRNLSNLGFLFTHDDWFPTWWTHMPDPSPMITGWAPFRCAERLSGKPKEFVVKEALKALGRALNVPIPEIENVFEDAYFHDWQSDPYSRGAYSYGLVGSDGMQEALGAPVENTLYFAGEATDVTLNNGTVHGAIASGIRAASEILKSVKVRG
jgi:monoamine oxidase